MDLRREDILSLLDELGLRSWLDIAEVVKRYYGSSGNAGSQELFWEDIAEAAQEGPLPGAAT
jgi:hypothetical protein